DVRMSFSGKHVEWGWPLIYWKQDYLNKAAFATRIGTAAAPAPREEGYAPRGEAEFAPAAFWLDVFISLAIVALPMAICEWLSRRRARRSLRELLSHQMC